MPMHYQQQANVGTRANNQATNPQAVMALMQNQLGAAPQPSANAFSFMNNGAPTNGIHIEDTQNPYSILPMEKPQVSFEEAFPKADRAAMLKDFEACEAMTLLNCPNTMYALFSSNTALMKDPKFLFSTLSGLYKQNYEILFNKYPSLNICIDFCLSMIIFKSLRALRTACSEATLSSGQALPNQHTKLQVARLIKSCKRVVGSTSRSSSNANNGASPTASPEKVQKSIDPEYTTLAKKLAKHPFMFTELLKTHNMLFNIGKCLEMCSPSDFAPLFVSIKLGMATRYGANRVKDVKMALVCQMRRPLICALGQRVVTVGQYYNLKYLDPLREILTKMTDFTSTESSMDYGKMGKLSITNIVENPDTQYVDKTMVFNNQGVHNMVVIDRINVFRVANNTFTSKSYSNSAYVMVEKDMCSYNADTVQTEVEKNGDTVDAEMAEYEKLVGLNEDDMITRLPWSLNSFLTSDEDNTDSNDIASSSSDESECKRQKLSDE